MGMFKEAADIQTADMLKLPIPELKGGKATDVVTKPSEFQKEMVQGLAARADDVRNRRVDATIDNMLKITNDGRKLALDQRLINSMLPDDENSKVNVCMRNVLKVWEDTKADKLTQLVFCDLSTPHYDGNFNVYDDIKQKLIAKGVPTNEIAFIHDAKTDTQKDELFSKVRSGSVRVLLGSTSKMGSGTNVQEKLVALHHLDVPWRPSDIEQQMGRILRQGNKNKEVEIFRYVTEGTFDAYSWSIIENKQKFIGQIMTSKSPVRSCEDIDETALSYAEVKALATGNPHIKEKMDLDISVAKLKVLKSEHTKQFYRLESSITQHFPAQIQHIKESIVGFKQDIQTLTSNPITPEKFNTMTLLGQEYTDKEVAGKALIEVCRNMKSSQPEKIGSYRGFDMQLSFDTWNKTYNLTLKGAMSYQTQLGNDVFGNIVRINNALETMNTRLESSNSSLENLFEQLEKAKVEITKPFPYETELAEKNSRLTELNNLLSGEQHIDEPTEDIPTEESEPSDEPRDVAKASDKSECSNVVMRDDKPSLLGRLKEAKEAVKAATPTIAKRDGKEVEI